jgi:serine kinase of HPr protein (carbohydrate metabolism regulator)
MASHHATALILGDRGVLIRGRSGMGKTSLAFALIERCRGAGNFASFVADDQVFLEPFNGRLVCRVPAPIAGLAEIRGLGPSVVGAEPAAVVDLVADLVAAVQAPRFAEIQTVVLEGREVGCLKLAAHETAGAALAIMAALGLQR